MSIRASRRRQPFRLAMRFAIGWVMVCAAFAGPLQASPRQLFPQMQKVGSASFGWFFWRAFEAELWSVNGKFSWEQPLALAITYRTDFSADELTAATLEEMERVGVWTRERIATLQEPITQCMVSVSDGDTFMAVSEVDSSVILYLNQKRQCEISGPGIKKAYLGIWLSDRSRFPEGTLDLRGRQQ
jgi:hypothetical protein